MILRTLLLGTLLMSTSTWSMDIQPLKRMSSAKLESLVGLHQTLSDITGGCRDVIRSKVISMESDSFGAAVQKAILEHHISHPAPNFVDVIGPPGLPEAESVTRTATGNIVDWAEMSDSDMTHYKQFESAVRLWANHNTTIFTGSYGNDFRDLTFASFVDTGKKEFLVLAMGTCE